MGAMRTDEQNQRRKAGKERPLVTGEDIPWWVGGPKKIRRKKKEKTGHTRSWRRGADF